jgi:hypothetical protein
MKSSKTMKSFAPAWLAAVLSMTAVWAATAAGPLPTPKATEQRDLWESLYIHGARIGYIETSLRPIQRDGVTVVEAKVHNHLSIQRGGTPVEIDIRFTSTETPDGRLVDFSSDFAPLASRGRVVGGRLEWEITGKGASKPMSVPCPAGTGGFNAVDGSLVRQPMKPGEKRSLPVWDIGTSQFATEELVARDYEPVKLLSGTVRLLRIDRVTRLGTTEIKGAVWTDRRGERLKASSESLGMESFVTSQAVATGAIEAIDLDRLLKTAIALDRPLDRPHETRRVRYRVHLEGGNPATMFDSGPSQQVRSIDAHTAEVTVLAIRPNDGSGDRRAKADPPTKADREPSSLIQSDSPKIVAQARAIAADEKDPWKICVALEQWVNAWIIHPDYTQVMDTAADVMESRRGDCTEYSVLLAALARARGIPARVAMGLVYTRQSFAYHMWDEVYLSGRWVPIDATLGRGGIGAAHLKIAHSSFDGPTAYNSLLPVAQAAGRLKIEVLEEGK